MQQTVKERIRALRMMLKSEAISAFIIPSTDPHLSEYVASYWKTREWISGFTGSAGTAVFTKDEAGLWTDGRYFLQAESELAGSGICGIAVISAIFAEKDIKKATEKLKNLTGEMVKA